MYLPQRHKCVYGYTQKKKKKIPCKIYLKYASVKLIIYASIDKLIDRTEEVFKNTKLNDPLY